MAAHSSDLAWRIPRTEEPGGLQSMGSQHDLVTRQQYITQYIVTISSKLSPRYVKNNT